MIVLNRKDRQWKPAKRTKARESWLSAEVSAALSRCSAWRRRLRADEAEVLLIDRNNFFVFHPFLVEAGTGSLHPQHAVVGLRAFTGARGLLMGEFTGADLSRRVVQGAAGGPDDERELPYDELVLAVGSVTSLPPIPGLSEHALPGQDRGRRHRPARPGHPPAGAGRPVRRSGTAAGRCFISWSSAAASPAWRWPASSRCSCGGPAAATPT